AHGRRPGRDGPGGGVAAIPGGEPVDDPLAPDLVADAPQGGCREQRRLERDLGDGPGLEAEGSFGGAGPALPPAEHAVEVDEQRPEPSDRGAVLHRLAGHAFALRSIPRERPIDRSSPAIAGHRVAATAGVALCWQPLSHCTGGSPLRYGSDGRSATCAASI